MNPKTVRGFFIATMAANVLLVSMMLLDYFYANSRFFSATLVTMGVLSIITASLFILMAVDEVRPLPQATKAAEPEPEPEPEEKAEEEKPAAKSEIEPLPPLEITPQRKDVDYVVVQPTIVAGLSPLEDGPFTFNGYTLYSREVKLKGGNKRPIYYFSKHKPKSGSPSPKPEGYHVGVNEETGLPFLKKGSGVDGEDVTPEHEHGLRPQCSALTEDGKQCRNSARQTSKYCASHFGYQPPAIPKAEAERRDTTARVKDAPDTIPAIRKH